MKKALSILLSFAILLLCVPLGALPTVKAATSGYYTYTVAAGKAIITDVSTSISGAVTIPSTLGGYPVTSIYWRAFRDCTSLTNVTISNNVTDISGFAFENCASLTTVTIPDSVTNIGYRAFANCTSITKLTIPDAVANIGEGAFQNCTALETVNYNAVDSGFAWDSEVGNLDYPVPAFSGCTALSTINIGAQVKSVSEHIFGGCPNLFRITIEEGNTAFCLWKGVLFTEDMSRLIKLPAGKGWTHCAIPDSVTSIGDYAFYGCTSLGSLTIPDSVTNIGGYAFYGCTSLTKLTIPDAVTDIGVSAFSGCTALTTVSYNAVACKQMGQYREVDGNYICSVAYAPVFTGCTSLATVYIGEQVKQIPKHAFYGCSALEIVHITDIDAWCGISFGDSYASPLCYAQKLYLNGSPVTDVVIPDGMTSIGNYAFSGCTTLASVTIPDSVTRIGDYAFSGCTTLASVTIPDNVTRIGGYAFQNCTSLQSVNFNAIECVRMGWYEYYVIGDFGNEEYRTEYNPVFTDCPMLTSITIGEQVKTIPDYAFANCSALTSITIPDKVTTIESNAFSGCTSLATVNYNAINCKTMGTDNSPVFASCTALKEVNIGNKVKTIPASAFSGCTQLTSIVIPDNVTNIAIYAFYNCTSLSSVSIGCGVTNIGISAFSRTALTSLFIPDSVITIKKSAFSNCVNLESVTIGDGVTDIGENAFNNCKALTAVTVGKNVTSIGDTAFNGCSSLAKVYFTGFKADWDKIYIGTDNAPLILSEFHDIQDICTHTVWIPATCDTQKTCTACGMTEGYPLGHVWNTPTCTAPITCYVCALTRGEALGHSYVNGVCIRCLDSEEKPTLTVVSTAAKAGETVTVTLAVRNAPAVKSLALTDFAYDSAVLELVGGEWLVSDSIIANWDAAKKNAAIVFGDNTAINSAVFTLTFRVKEGVAFTTLPITCQAVAKTVVNGAERDLPISVAGGEIVWGVRGNIDGNGTVDNNDAVYLLYYTLLPEEYPLTQGGDIDRNGTVDSDDAIYLLYYCLLPEQYPLV